MDNEIGIITLDQLYFKLLNDTCDKNVTSWLQIHIKIILFFMIEHIEN